MTPAAATRRLTAFAALALTLAGPVAGPVASPGGATPTSAPVTGEPGPATPPEVTVPPAPERPGGTPHEQGPPPVPAPTDRPAPAVAASEAVLRTGHVDVATRLDGARLRTELVLEAPPAPPRRHDPARATMFVADGARTVVPENPDFGFLGPPGSPVWILPQTQDPDLLWVGWNTEAIPPGSLPGPVRWTLRGLQGPGRFALFTTDGFGRPRPLLVAGGTPGEMEVPLGTHAHGNWAFTAPGQYSLDLEVTATGTAAERVGLRFQVGELGAPTPTTPAPTPTTATVGPPGGVASLVAGGGTGAATMPRTGPSATAAVAAVGTACVAAGLGLRRRARSRSRPR